MITFNRTDVSLFKEVNEKYGKSIDLVFFIYILYSLKKIRVIIFAFIPTCFSFDINAANSLYRFVLKKKTADTFLVFFNWLPFFSLYSQIYFLNVCKLSWVDNFFDFFVRISSLHNQNTYAQNFNLITNNSHLLNSNLRIGIYFDQLQTIM